MHILQHTILMDTAGMGKGIAPDNGLVGLYRHIHQRGHHTRDRINLRSIDVCIDFKVLMAFENHRNLFQRGVTSPFTDAVDGHFHLTGTRHHTTEGVGCCQSKVIMTMC